MSIIRLLFTLLTTTLLISCGCGGTKVVGRSVKMSDARVEQIDSKKSADAPKRYKYRVVEAFAHNTTSYTQGLFWYDNNLWESTGMFGSSALKKVEIDSGNILESIALDDKYFGEGATILNERIYQLTWMNKRALVYDVNTLEKVEEISYKGEGWGITNDGEKLYMSNGTDKITVVNPNDFKVEHTIAVQMNGRRVQDVNELEWIDGRIWANIYMSDMIIIINPATGVVEAYLDMKDLLPESERLPSTDVLNGIAYDVDQGRVFVTGKNWPKLFHIEVLE